MEPERSFVQEDMYPLGQDVITLSLRRRITPIAISTQLSGVTAPLREDDKSASSSSDPNAVADGVFEPDVWKQHLVLDWVGIENFGEVMYDMNREGYFYRGLD